VLLVPEEYRRLTVELSGACGDVWAPPFICRASCSSDLLDGGLLNGCHWWNKRHDELNSADFGILIRCNHLSSYADTHYLDPSVRLATQLLGTRDRDIKRYLLDISWAGFVWTAPDWIYHPAEIL
jgi:hypothetical protein